MRKKARSLILPEMSGAGCSQEKKNKTSCLALLMLAAVFRVSSSSASLSTDAHLHLLNTLVRKGWWWWGGQVWKCNKHLSKFFLLTNLRSLRFLPAEKKGTHSSVGSLRKLREAGAAPLATGGRRKHIWGRSLVNRRRCEREKKWIFTA